MLVYVFIRFESMFLLTSVHHHDLRHKEHILSCSSKISCFDLVIHTFARTSTMPVDFKTPKSRHLQGVACANVLTEGGRDFGQQLYVWVVLVLVFCLRFKHLRVVGQPKLVLLSVEH